MSGAVVLLVLLGLAFPLVLYALVRSEHRERETMDWESAERAARRDASDPDSRRGVEGTDGAGGDSDPRNGDEWDRGER